MLFTITEHRDIVLSADLLRQLGVLPGAGMLFRQMPDGCIRIEFERPQEHRRGRAEHR